MMPLCDQWCRCVTDDAIRAEKDFLVLYAPLWFPAAAIPEFELATWIFYFYFFFYFFYHSPPIWTLRQSTRLSPNNSLIFFMLSLHSSFVSVNNKYPHILCWEIVLSARVVAGILRPVYTRPLPSTRDSRPRPRHSWRACPPYSRITMPSWSNCWPSGQSVTITISFLVRQITSWHFLRLAKRLHDIDICLLTFCPVVLFKGTDPFWGHDFLFMDRF